MNISKSTPYVRYKENFSSTLHLGSIHVESEYLDRTQKTTLESIQGMTWHNKVVNENRELNLLSEHSLLLEGETHKEFFDTTPHRLSVDEIHGLQDVEPNEDGTFTYRVTSLEGEYAQIYDGVNNIVASSDTLEPQFEIIYDTNEEDLMGNIVLDDTAPNHTIEMSNVGTLDGVMTGKTLVNNILDSSDEEYVCLGEYNSQSITINNSVEGNFKSAILKGQTLVNVLSGEKKDLSNNEGGNGLIDFLVNQNLKANAVYTAIFKVETNAELLRVGITATSSSWNSSSATYANGNNKILLTTTTETAYSLRFRYNDTSLKSLVVSNVMLIEGDYTNVVVPYFEGMQSVKMPVLKTVGKNLFDLENSGIRNEDNFDKSIGGYGLWGFPVKLSPNTSYTISRKDNSGYGTNVDFMINNVLHYANYKWLIGSHSQSANVQYNSITTNNDGIIWLLFNSNFDKVNQALDICEYIQIEEGSTISPFEPFKSDILTVNEEVELRGIVDVKDELNLLTGEVTQRIHEVILDGNTLWNYGNTESGWNQTGEAKAFYSQQATHNKLFANKKKNGISITDKMETVIGANITVNKYDTDCFGLGNLGYVIIRKTGVSTPEELQQWLSENPITVQYELEESTVKTVDLTVLDQDNNPTTFHSYNETTHINTSSDGLVPFIEIDNPKYEVMLKPNTTYTIKMNRTNVPENSDFQVNLAGVVTSIDNDVESFTVQTYSTLSNNEMKFIGCGNKFKNVMLLEGNHVNSQIEHFEGMQSVENPSLETVGKNLFNKDAFYNDWKSKEPTYVYKEFVDGQEVLKVNNFYHLYSEEKGFKIKVKKNVPLTISFDCKKAGEETTNAVFTIRYGEGKYRPFSICHKDEWVHNFIDITPTRDYITICSGYNNNGYFYVRNIQIEYSSAVTEYAPHKSNILTVNEPVELRGIGNIQDELNLVTGELTQRIGEIVLDGSDDETWSHEATNDLTSRFFMKLPGYENFSNNQIVSFVNDKLPEKDIYELDEEGTLSGWGGLYVRIKNDKLITPSTLNFKTWLQQNPITVQYQLTTKSVKTVDLSILDQDGKQLRTFHTFEDTTHIFTSSDTLIPNTNIDYEITTSVATVTGSSASFDNGEEGSPISAVVYGESKYRDINTGELLDEFDSERELEIIGVESPILTIQGELSENILSTYPQVTLHSIGDIRDEIDYVNETVTRRIGEVVLDGSEGWGYAGNDDGTMRFNLPISDFKNYGESSNGKNLINNKLPKVDFSTNGNKYGVSTWCNHVVFFTEHTNVNDFKQWLSNNPTTVQYELVEPITESVRITPPNPQTYTASITIPTQLNHVEDTSDYVIWNPYKEHYVRYNHVQDGQPLEHYTWDNLEDLNERQYIEIYDRRTYVEQEYENYISSHESKGATKYVLLEPNHDYTVSVRFSELPKCETVKVNLGGAEVEMDVNNPHVHITTPTPLLNNLCSILGDGLTGKITDILVIHCLYHEGFADIDYFEGIDGIGEIVDGGVNITMQQCNGNILDEEPVVFSSGNYVGFGYSGSTTKYGIKVRPLTQYRANFITQGDNGVVLINDKNEQIKKVGANQSFVTTQDTEWLKIYTAPSSTGSADRYYDFELIYPEFYKEGVIRPRYYDIEELILPMQLCRIHDTYDNLYYDEAKGFYRIQQTIGHKYFTGTEGENWTLIENTGRVLRFRYNNADIQIKSLGEYMTNLLPNGTTSSPYESCTFNGTTFIVSLDIERFEIISLEQFKLWLSEHPLHLYYQLMTPIMIDLPQYNKRIEFNTYKDEIYTFFKNCKPTVFTLGVPLDKTYRFYELEQGEGYANRVELTDECMTDEDTLYIDTIHGSGFSNLIENPNNVETLLKPNYQGSAVSHTLTNGKVSSIKVHGFEPNETTIANYNSTLKQYELIVQAQKGGNVNTQTLAVPYKLEVYEDGTKDKVYYSEQYNQWIFEGGSVTSPLYNASYVFNTPLEVFKGIAPRTGLIAEIKVKFNSGTTSARIYYSLDGGATTAYSTLRNMTDEVEYYIGFFNTGGTKLDYATKLSAEAEYTNLAPLSSTLPESLIITQIQNITECTFTLDKTYYFDSWIQPLELDVYNGETIITEQSGSIVTINNNGLHKDALTYTDETYTVYWTYVGGEGNVTITLGGAKVEVVGTQGYATLKTAIDGVQDGLIIGGYNLSIKDLMLIKGERIEDLAYFEGSRAVGTAFVDEDGETKYKITLVTGSHLVQHNFEDRITFEDDKKHNVVVTKLLGNKPNKK